MIHHHLILILQAIPSFKYFYHPSSPFPPITTPYIPLPYDLDGVILHTPLFSTPTYDFLHHSIGNSPNSLILIQLSQFSFHIPVHGVA